MQKVWFSAQTSDLVKNCNNNNKKANLCNLIVCVQTTADFYLFIPVVFFSFLVTVISFQPLWYIMSNWKLHFLRNYVLHHWDRKLHSCYIRSLVIDIVILSSFLFSLFSISASVPTSEADICAACPVFPIRIWSLRPAFPIPGSLFVLASLSHLVSSSQLPYPTWFNIIMWHYLPKWVTVLLFVISQ